MTSTRPRRTQAERTFETRSALIGAARRLFAANGYADTGLDEIVSGAGVTRGALYHHFESKTDLFRAVVDAVDGELADKVVSASLKGVDARDMIRLAALAYVQLCARADYARIIADVPSVIGIDATRNMSGAYCLDLLERAIDAAKAEGAAVAGEPKVLAAMLLGALNEAVMLMAARPSSRSTRADVSRTVEAAVLRLLGREPQQRVE